MKSLYKIITIPKYLNELHGIQSRKIDLILTYITAIIGTVFTLYLAIPLSIPIYKFILLGVLAFDIAGGVVANFTEGTQNYYLTQDKLRYRFISLHFLHPSLLIFIFPGNCIYISVVAVFTLIAISILNRAKSSSNQKLFASFFALIGVSLSFILNVSQPIVHMMMVLFIIKLIIAFSIKWTRVND